MREPDELLETALKSYTAAEPRAGLENRIVACTASAKKPHDRFGLLFAFAAALVLALGVRFIPHRASHRPEPAAASITYLRKNEPLPHAGSLQHAAAKPARKLRVRFLPAAASAGKPLVILPPSSQERMLLQLAASSQSPLAKLNSSAPLEIQPIEISALRIKPLPLNAKEN